MKWLAQLHQDWMTARKRRIAAPVRGFRRDWEQLLEDAGITTAEDQNAARREAEKTPQIRLIPRKRNPRFIDKIELPPESEGWLHERFQTLSAMEKQQLALAALAQWSAPTHPIHTEAWTRFCEELAAEFRVPRVCGPFDWQDHKRVEELLDWLFKLTSQEWSAGTLIRDASQRMGLDSKGLEAQQTALERALELMFGREMTLEALGIQTSNSYVHFSGPLRLHFADGTTFAADALRFESTVSVAELERASRITTTADRLLTIENRKTTFLQCARADRDRTTLIVASSWPTQAVKLLLSKLPQELPHYHFGDTDVWGFDILRAIRGVTARWVKPFLMHRREREASQMLTKREIGVLSRLLSDPVMEDCRPDMEAMRTAGSRGDYEQESLGAPTLREWPWFAEAASPSVRRHDPAQASSGE